MGFIIFIIIFSIVVILALIGVFIAFLVKGSKGAKEDKTLFEKGMITQEQFDSGFNQGTKQVVKENYAEFRRQAREDRIKERREELAKQNNK